jgi:hypothetical protein
MNPSTRSTAVHPIALICHPLTPCKGVHRIEVQVQRTAEATLELRYSLEGDIDGLRIPVQSAPRRADKLWEHTCFEAFVAPDGIVNGYYEFNFPPSTQWAMYRFSAYREEMVVVEIPRPPHVSVRHENGRMSLEAVIDLEPLPDLRQSPGLRLALSAIVEDAEHCLSYWALAHPVAKPDFHHADSFAFTLRGTTPSPSGEGRGEGIVGARRTR